MAGSFYEQRNLCAARNRASVRIALPREITGRRFGRASDVTRRPWHAGRGRSRCARRRGRGLARRGAEAAEEIAYRWLAGLGGRASLSGAELLLRFRWRGGCRDRKSVV